MLFVAYPKLYYLSTCVYGTRSHSVNIYPPLIVSNLEPLTLDIVCHPINTSGTVVIYLPAQPYQNHRGQGPCGDIGRKGIAKKTTIVHVSVLLHGIGVIIFFIFYICDRNTISVGVEVVNRSHTHNCQRSRSW